MHTDITIKPSMHRYHPSCRSALRYTSGTRLSAPPNTSPQNRTNANETAKRFRVNSEKTRPLIMSTESPRINDATDMLAATGTKHINSDVSKPLRDQVNWPTPNVPERGKELSKSHRPESGGIDLQSSVLTKKVLQNGLLAQDSPSTNGKSRELWPTINQRDTRKGCKQAQLASMQKQKGKLNPDWVEQLMGLKVGWTDCDCWETG